MAFGLDLGNLLVHLKADSTHFNRVMRGVESTMLRTGKRLIAISKRFAKYSAIALVAKATLSVKAFASFEEQLANVATMLDEQTMHYLPAYAESLKKMAVEFGEGTDTLSKGLYDILSASVAPSKAIDVLGASVKAAKAGLTDTAVAADAITTILNSYGMAAEDAGKISDVLFAIVKRGKTTFAELAPQIGKVASLASTAGLSFEEMGAALATMTRAGIQTDIAITSLRTIVGIFLRPMESAVVAARNFGLELSSTSLRSMGLVGVLRKLKDATAEQLAAIFPEKRALAGVAAMMKQLENQADDLNLMLNSLGMTQTAYEKMTDILVHTMRRLWQVIKITAVSIGERLAPSVEEASQYFIKNQAIIEDWATAFADRIVFVWDVMRGFLRVLRTDFKGGLEGLFDLFLDVFEAAAKVAIELSIRTGKGIWEGLKQGIFGGTTKKEIDALAKEMYRKAGGTFAKIPLGQMPTTVTGYKMTREVEMILDVALFARMQKEARAQLEGVVADSVFKGFPERAKQIWDEFKIDAAEGMGGVANIMDEAMETLAIKDAIREQEAMWREMEEEALIYKDILKDTGGAIDAMTESLEDVAVATAKINVPMIEGGEKIQEMLDALGVELELLGLINEERERAQDIIKFEKLARDALGKDTENYLEVMRQYTEKWDELIAGKKGWAAAKTVLKNWSRDATNIYENVANMAVRTFDRISQSLTNMLMAGKFQFREFARSIIADLLQIIIRAQTAKMAMAIFPGLFPAATPVPSPKAMAIPLQRGGLITRPTLAMLGEKEPELITPLSQLAGIMRREESFEIHLHNEGTKQEISRAESYLLSSQRIIDVWTKDAIGGGITGRTVRKVMSS